MSRLLGIVETRVDLFALELQEEKLRLVQVLIWASATVFLAAAALIMLTLLVLLAFWHDPEQRFIAVVVIFLLYLLGSIYSGISLNKRLKREAMPFAETLGQLKKDRACCKD